VFAEERKNQEKDVATEYL